jgi:PKD-like domain
MPRKSLWFGLALAMVVAISLLASVDAKPRKKKKEVDRPSGPPSLSLAAEPAVIKACNDESARVRLVATAQAVNGATLRYKWSTSSGRLRGDGANTNWDLAGVQPGVYQAFVEVDDGRDLSCVAFSSVAVIVSECPPPPPAQPVCPNVTVSCPDAANENAPATFTATISGGSPGITPSYNWTVSAGKIISGQGTPNITVDTAGLAGQTVRANLDVGGFGMRCPASCATSLPIVNKPRKFDEYYDIVRNDEKARLDNYAIQLQSEPGSQAYVIVYASRRAKGKDAQTRGQRISDYLVNTRGIDSHRVVITNGPAREDWLFELWVVPEGAPPPTPNR